MTKGGRSAAVFAIAIPVAILCALALTVIDRPGYSPDEELTAVIASGISQSGAPLLPSGVFYNRGLPYSYLAWIAGELGGRTLPAYRFASFLCALAGILIAVRLGRQLGSAPFGVVAGILLASFPAYVAAAVFARPYAALVLCALVFMAFVWRGPSTGRSSGGLLVSLALAVLLHPLGAALVAIPWISLAVSGRRDSMLRLAFHASAVALAMIVVSYGAHFVSLALTGTPFYSGTAIYAIPTAPRPPMFSFALVGARGWTLTFVVFALASTLLVWRVRANMWIVAVVAAAGLSFQLGLLVLAAAVGVILRPGDWKDWARAGGISAAVAVTWWSGLIAYRANAQLSLDFVTSLAGSATVYPLSTLKHTAALLPALSVLAVAGTAFAMRAPHERASEHMRGVAAFVLLLFTASEVAGVPLTERYLLFPWTFLVLLSAHGVIACAHLAGRVLSQRPAVAVPALATVSCLVFAVTVGGQYRYARERGSERSGESVTTAMLAPRTGSWTPATFRVLVRPRDTIICTEEIACLYLLGRADYLFTLPPQDTEDYVSIRSGRPVGFYASRPAISDEARLTEVMSDVPPDGCAIVVSLNTGKAGFGLYSVVAARAARGKQFQALIESEDTFVGRACAGQLGASPERKS